MGCLLGGPLSDLLGRRRSLRLFGVASLLGWAVVALSRSTSLLFVGRFVQGCADSLSVAPSILFVGEISDVRWRGTFMTFSTILYTLGVPVVYIVGALLPWRPSAWIGAAIPGVIVAMLTAAKESPVFLLKRGRRVLQAEAALRWYRGREADCGAEFEELLSASQETRADSGSGDGRHRHRSVLRPFLILSLLFFLLPQSGIYCISYFALDLFKELGSGGNETVITIFTGLVRTFGAVCALYAVGKIGRRRILIASTFFVFFGIEVAFVSICMRWVKTKMSRLRSSNFRAFSCRENIVLGAEVNLILGYVVAGAILFVMFATGVGMTPVPWILIGEWFPPANKAFIGSFCTALFNISNFLSIQVPQNLFSKKKSKPRNRTRPIFSFAEHQLPPVPPGPERRLRLLRALRLPQPLPGNILGARDFRRDLLSPPQPWKRCQPRGEGETVRSRKEERSARCARSGAHRKRTMLGLNDNSESF